MSALRAACAAALVCLAVSSCTPAERQTVVEYVEDVPKVIADCVLAQQNAGISDEDIFAYCKAAKDLWPILRDLLANAREGAKKGAPVCP